ncbi:MAG: CoA-binding protein [Flavobacteriales bacterium]|nr:CoA-binding protein [Flavobacteriales bacterium]
MKSDKKTLVLGASPNPERYAFRAANLLKSKGYEIVQLGKRTGVVAGQNIETKAQFFDDIHTVTLYLGPQNQKEYYQYLIALQPKRVVFNPGTENDELIKLLQKNGIETLEACTLVMLNLGNY